MPGGRGQRKGRGGYQAPAKPAAVSGVGAAARRTDGGPSQPVRPIPSGGPGATQGDRAASVALQQAAPLEVAAGPPPAAGQPQPIAASGPPVDPFGPTRRPDEPVTSGASLGPGSTPNPMQDARDVLGQLYAMNPLPELLEMLEELDEELG